MPRRGGRAAVRCKGRTTTHDPDTLLFTCDTCDRPVKVTKAGFAYSHYPLKDASKTDNRHSTYILNTYGITGEQYEALLAHQGGVCFICQKKPLSKRLAVDHDHTDGWVRGLLCRRCNHRLLGSAHDGTAILLRAVDYLNNPPAFDCFDTRIKKED